jgi:hypothetical protein
MLALLAVQRLIAAALSANHYVGCFTDATITRCALPTTILGAKTS